MKKQALQSLVLKKLTNDEVVRLHNQWRQAQMWHAARRATKRLVKKQKFTEGHLMKVMLQEFKRLV